MYDYSVRIVLHGATAQQYARLHERMATAGAVRFVVGSDRVAYDLPDGHYRLVNAAGIETVRNAVGSIARAVKAVPDPSILVEQVVSRAWRLRPVPGRS